MTAPTHSSNAVEEQPFELWVSKHAVDRFRERVADMPTRKIIAAVRALAKTASVRPAPRHWMSRETNDHPGTTFLYNSTFPDICLVVTDRCVVTIITREACRKWRRFESGSTTTDKRVFNADIVMLQSRRDLPQRPSLRTLLAELKGSSDVT